MYFYKLFSSRYYIIAYTACCFIISQTYKSEHCCYHVICNAFLYYYFYIFPLIDNRLLLTLYIIFLYCQNKFNYFCCYVMNFCIPTFKFHFQFLKNNQIFETVQKNCYLTLSILLINTINIKKHSTIFKKMKFFLKHKKTCLHFKSHSKFKPQTHLI